MTSLQSSYKVGHWDMSGTFDKMSHGAKKSLTWDIGRGTLVGERPQCPNNDAARFVLNLRSEK